MDGKNHLTLNCCKTKIMTYGTMHTLGILDRSPPRVILNNIEIETVNGYKYLGVVLDWKLTFSNHMQYLTGKAIVG